MSLTSYRAAPPRGEVCRIRGFRAVGRGGCEERGGALVRSGGDLLSRVYDGAVPSAVARLTAEFGMGSGVSRSLWPPDRIKAPHIRFQVAHHGVVHASCPVREAVVPCPSLDRIKPIGRLVPVN